jgi:hypothetical protein
LYDVVPVFTPSAAFSLSSHIVNTGVNDLVTYTGGGSSSGTFTWNFGGGSATPGTGIGPNWVNWSTPGLKTITLSVTDSGCSSVVFSDTVLVVVPSVVTQLSESEEEVSIVPNPSQGTFEVVFDPAIAGEINLKLTDVQGRVVYESDYFGTTNNKVSIQSQFLAPGLYTATVISEGTVVNKKVIIAR